MYAEMQILLCERARLYLAEEILTRELGELEGKQAATGRSAFRDIIDRAEQSFEAGLARSGYSRDDIFERIRRDVESADPEDIFQYVRGSVIADPERSIWDPKINPDFIAALEKCTQLNSRMFTCRGWYEDSMKCNKHPDGSFVMPFAAPRFGVSRGAFQHERTRAGRQ
jgi:hypothetical protein